jgi:carbon starvation protein
MNAAALLVVGLLVLALAYRYYGAFLAARVAVLDDRRQTPAHSLRDGQNYHPTNKWVLFGHHFAAISGAGPLIGPVLAAQFGYAPGFLWLLIGAVLAGSVHDFMILIASVRHQGRSLAEIARGEISPLAGLVGSVAVLVIIVVALAGLGVAVVNALKDSPWGTFTIAMTIPAALFTGLWMYRIRPGRVAEASVIGFSLVLLAVLFGGQVPGSFLAPHFTLGSKSIVIALATYGFVASVLPVWLLLCPRDYLSSYLKAGTVALLVAGVLVVQPQLRMPAVTAFAGGGGPVIPGKLFPFLFITIACGALSGFHALVGSGTTPKMINKERDTLLIGYGAMLLETCVSIVALIAACSLFPGDYFAINVPPDQYAALGMQPVNLAELSRQVGENVAGRPGGAVSLAVGFAQIFAGLPWLSGLLSYWYHFAIMFEALFILTAIDTGTRVARYLLQEFGGRVYEPFARTDWMPGTILSTGVIVFSWSYLLWTGSVGTIWPMFGAANQLLAGVALAVAGSWLINTGKAKYVWVTIVPMTFVAITTVYAGWLNLTETFLPMASDPRTLLPGTVNAVLTVVILVSAVVILAEALRHWLRSALKERPGDTIPASSVDASRQ